MREINKLYLASFLYGFGSIAGFTFTLYFLYRGLTFTEISILFSVFMISLALFEIPTGGYADTVGHKKSVYIGMFIEALYFFIFFFSTNFYGFLIGMIVAAFGLALQSGAIQSLLYELLKTHGKEDEYAKAQGRYQSISLLTGIIAAPVGTLLFKYYPQLPYALSFFFIALTSLVIYNIRWEYIPKDITVKRYLQNIKTGIMITLKNNKLLGFIIIGLGLTVSRLVYGQNINQPFQLSLGIDVAAIGVVEAVASVLMAAVAFYAHRVLKKIGGLPSILLVILVPSICMIILSQIHTTMGLIFIFAFYMSSAFRNPVMGVLSQKETPSEQRSTIASTGSFISSIAVGVLLPFWGMSIDKFGLHTTLMLLGIFTVSIGFVGVVVARKIKV